MLFVAVVFIFALFFFLLMLLYFRWIKIHICIYPWMKWTILTVAFSADANLHSLTPGRLEGWVSLGTTAVCKQSAQYHYVADIAVVSCSNCYALLGKWVYTANRQMLPGKKSNRGLCDLLSRQIDIDHPPRHRLTIVWALEWNPIEICGLCCRILYRGDSKHSTTTTQEPCSKQ